VADKEDKMADFDFSSLGSMFGGALGGTPSGLDALLSEDQRKLLGRNATLSAAAALLQASGRGPQRIGLGQALGSALQAGQQGYQQARAGSLQDLLVGEKIRESQAERARDVDYFAMLKAAGQPAQPMPTAGAQIPLPPADIDGPGVQVFAPDAPKAAAPAPAPNIYANLTQDQRTLLAGMPRKEGAKYLLDLLKPQETVGQPFLGQDNKFYIQTKTGGVIPAPIAPAAKPVGAPQQVLGAGDKPVLVQYYDDGSYKQVGGVSPLITPEKVDTGAGIQFVNPFAQAPGSIIPKTLAPQVVGSAEDGYFVVGGGGGARPRPAVGPAAAVGATAPAGGAAPVAPAAAPTPATAPVAAPAAAGPVPLIPGTGKAFAREKDLRATFTTEMKPFTDLAQAFRKVEAAALNPSAAGDISLVYGYMKILDPGSTVMQGEQATAANAGGVSDRVRAMYNKALTGETLADNVRQDFYAQSRNLIESQRPLQQDISERYGLIATQNKLDPNQIVFDPFKRIMTPAEIAAEAAKEKDKKKKPASYNNTYNLLPRN
jgi:hypothetical protein